jgi:hypothetical protein
VVVAEVYHHLVNGLVPDSTKAAHALHHAIRHLHEQLKESGTQSFYLGCHLFMLGCESNCRYII